jgi:hypothetical protein
MRQVTVALGLLALLACGGGGGGGGGSPTTASAVVSTPSPMPIAGWPAGTTVQLVDGDTGQLVQGPVVVAGVTVQAGAPLPSAAAVGATVDVSIPGFLPRATLVRTGETRLMLWPDSATLPGDYTRSLVYVSSYTDAGVEVLDSLRRLPTRVRTVAVVPSADIMGDSDAMDAHRDAIDGINGATAQLGLVYQLGGTGDLSVPTRVDPTAGSCPDRLTHAFANVWVSGANEITRAEITFCSSEIAATFGTVAHELGHTVGLRHSLDAHDMMYPWVQSSTSPTPTTREALTISLMRARRAGSQWPDNDRDASGAAAVRVETIVD